MRFARRSTVALTTLAAAASLGLSLLQPVATAAPRDAAGQGTTITVSATGADAAEAITAIAHLVGSKFGEGE